MHVVKYTYWKDGAYYIGYLNDYPDYRAQGFSKQELIDNLKEIFKDIDSGEVPCIRKVEINEELAKSVIRKLRHG